MKVFGRLMNCTRLSDASKVAKSAAVVMISEYATDEMKSALNLLELGETGTSGGPSTGYKLILQAKLDEPSQDDTCKSLVHESWNEYRNKWSMFITKLDQTDALELNRYPMPEFW